MKSLYPLTLVALVGCANIEHMRTVWPPEDFQLELESGVTGDHGLEVRKIAQFYRDGLVVYRETDRDSLKSSVHGASGLPVFHRVCAYRLRSESIRMLSRLLDRQGVADMPPVIGTTETAGESGAWLSLRWAGFEKRKAVHVRGRVYGPLGGVLHVINSFLPKQHPFEMPEMTGTVEPRHVESVPPLRDSVAGSLRFHQQLVETLAADPRWERDLFALACAGADWAVAERCLARLRLRLGKNQRRRGQLFPEMGDFDVMAHFNEVLELARAQQRSRAVSRPVPHSDEKLP